MELKRKPAQQDASISDKLSTGGFWKKPRMSCIPVTEHHVFHFDFPDSEESFDLEEDESSSDHDEVGESDADEAVSSKKSSTSCGFRARTRCFAVRDFPTLLSRNPADVPAEPHDEESEPEEDNVPAKPHDEESEPEEDDVPAEPHDEESEPEEDDVPAEPRDEESDPEEYELDEGVDDAHMDMSDEESDIDEFPEDIDVDESPKVVDVDEVESQANFDLDSDQDGDFNADESEHDNKVASSESSVKYIRRPRYSAVRDFPPGILQDPQPVVEEEEEVEPFEDDYSEGTDESVVINPSEDDSDVGSDETQSGLEVDSREDDEYKLVEAEDDETSYEYIESDDEADLSGYITCLCSGTCCC